MLPRPALRSLAPAVPRPVCEVSWLVGAPLLPHSSRPPACSHLHFPAVAHGRLDQHHVKYAGPTPGAATPQGHCGGHDGAGIPGESPALWATAGRPVLDGSGRQGRQVACSMEPLAAPQGKPAGLPAKQSHMLAAPLPLLFFARRLPTLWAWPAPHCWFTCSTATSGWSEAMKMRHAPMAGRPTSRRCPWQRAARAAASCGRLQP